MTLPGHSLQFFYPTSLLVEFYVISFFQSSFFSQQLCCSESKGKLPWLQPAQHFYVKPVGLTLISSQVCLITKLAMGKRPTAVYCQYWTMLLSLLTVASSLIFPSLLSAASFPSAACIFAQRSFEHWCTTWMSLKQRALWPSLMLPPERKRLV